MMLGVDILPSELPRDASEHFGRALLPLLPPLLTYPGIDRDATDELDGLPAELRRACITSHGNLQQKWTYIQRLREQAAVLTASVANPKKHILDVELIVSHSYSIDFLSTLYVLRLRAMCSVVV